MISRLRLTSAYLADLDPPLWCIPIGPNKTPAICWKPFQTRRPTPSELDGLCSRFPNANAATVTGEAAGIFVLDIDSPEGDEYVAIRCGGTTNTWRAKTPHGGHDYFRWPNFPVRNSVKKLGPFDIRGTGGYALAPGSRGYSWIPGYSPRDRPLSDAPDWLLNELRQRAQRECNPTTPLQPVRPYSGQISEWSRKAFTENVQHLLGAPPGTRNDALFSVARRFGQLSAAGHLDADIVLEPLFAAAQAWGGDIAHSRSTITRAFALGLASPCNPKRA